MGVFGLGSILASIVGGHLADQIGRRTVMVSALLGGAALLVVLSMVQSPVLLVLGIFAFSLVVDTYRPAAAAMIGDLASPEQRTRAFGLLYISINLGFTCGAALGGIIASYSFQWLFLGDALTTGIFGLGIVAFLPETRPKHSGEQSEDDAPSQGVPFLEAVRHVFSDGPFLMFCLATLALAMVFMQGMSTLPLYLRAEHGITERTYGFLMAINGLMIFLGQLPLTSWLERYNRMTIIVLGGIAISIGFGITQLGTTAAFFALTVVLWTLGEMMHAPFTNSIVTDLAPTALRARYQGMLAMCFSGALTIGAPIGGEVLARFGSGALWSGAFTLGLLACALYLSAHRAIMRRVS